MSEPTSPADLVILGGGSGGYAAAFRASELGLNVVLIEKDKVGGTCLHRGCIPTKALLHAGEVADLAREGEQFGVKTSLAGIDMDGVNAYKDGVVSKLYKGLQGLVKARKITYVEGEGRLTSPTTVEVNGQTYEGKHILLATGSYARSLPGLEIDGTEGHHQRPRARPRPGPGVGDRPRRRRHRLRVRQRVEVLRRRRHHRRGAPPPRPARGRGVLQAARARVPPPQDRLRARQPVLRRPEHRERREGLARERQGARGRAAARRRRPRAGQPGPRLRGGRASQMDRGFVLVDEYCRTNVPTISAVGDLIPTLQLAHVGFGEGILVAERIAGLNPAPIDYAGVPRITYSDPEVASVGLTEAQAKEKYGEVKTLTYDLAGNGRSQILKTAGAVKLVQADDGPVVGVHMVGSRVGELIAEAQLIYNWEAEADDVASLIHPHPTQSEALGEAHLALAGKPLHVHG